MEAFGKAYCRDRQGHQPHPADWNTDVLFRDPQFKHAQWMTVR